MKKNILIFSEFFYPHWTGLSKSIFNFSIQLSKKNNITVVTTKYKKDLAEMEVKETIKVIRKSYLFKFSRTYYSLSTLLWAVKHIKNQHLIIINSPHSNILFLSAITKLFRKKLFIYHQGDLILPKKTGNQLLNRIIEKIFDTMTIISMFLANKIATYTKDYAHSSRVMKYFTYKFTPVIPPIYLSSQKPSLRFKNTISRLKKKYILIGFAGRFVEEKGFDILLSAMPWVTKQIPNALFVFAGETKLNYESFFEKQKKYIKENKQYVKILGLLSGGDLNLFYKALEMFVLSSRSDCFALTQAEAMLSGTPVVVTNIPGARMLVKETGFGEIANSKDPEDLAKKIIKVIKYKKNYKKKEKNVLKFLKKYEFAEENI